MSELFDSLNFNASAGPSSSQSSSQPSTSKVYWHASPSPGVLQQLRSWKDQHSPTLPLCTQAFVGELRKLPASSSLNSPLVSKSGAKRKLTAGFSAVHHHGIVLSDDDDEDEVHSDTEQGKRVAAARITRNGKDIVQDSPDSRRILDAGHTGRLRQPSPDSLSTTSTTSLEAGPAPNTSSRRSERRSIRRRKKDSFIAGLGLSDQQSRGTDCLKLFEDLQAAIQDMQSQSTTLPFENGAATTSSQLDGKLTPRGLINRTTSAPILVENAQNKASMTRSHDLAVKPATHTSIPARTETGVVARRMFTPTKSDHDVFRASLASQAQQREPLRPTTNVSAHQAEQGKKVNQHSHEARPISPPVHAAPVSDDAEFGIEAIADLGDDEIYEITHVKRAEPTVPEVDENKARSRTELQPSPVKRSARIEAMHVSTGKKLGVRVSPSVARSRTHSPGKVQVSRTPQRSRSNVLPGMSQARQPGLPRNCSQFTSSQAQSSGPGVLNRSGPPAGLRAPFRPPARAQPLATNNRADSPGNTSSSKRSCQQPSSSDDSFPDEDDDFLALACQLDY